MHSRLPFAVTPVALVVCALWHGLPVAAQTPEVEAPLQLKPSTALREGLSDPERRQLATHLSGDRLSGRPDLETVLDGNAILRKGDIVVRADRLEYYQPDDLARARGNVRVNRAGNIYEGPLLELKVDAFEGFFNEPRYRFLRNNAYGQADRIDFLDDKRAVVRNATYSTCQRRPGPDWMPDWILRAASMRLDSEEEVGQADLLAGIDDAAKTVGVSRSEFISRTMQERLASEAAVVIAPNRATSASTRVPPRTSNVGRQAARPARVLADATVVKTGKQSAAAAASKVLRDPKASKDAKTAAASALTQKVKAKKK